ncbi:MAG TPA: hypothetical protein VD862_01220 [Candidatus Paceibacterota bacterium]|nr:hypothetical protein [Candidatus Paceibacterota bacterium]
MKTRRKEGLTVETLKKSLALFLLIMISASHAVTPTAHAGLLDWLGTRANGAEPAYAKSFAETEQMYLGATTLSGNTVEPAMSGHAYVAQAPTDTDYIGRANRTLRYVTVSAYNSEVAQTDDSPFIMANGNHVHWGAVAANVIDSRGRNLPFGTRVKIPSLFGDQIFVVEDRMNKRYSNNIDVWMESKTDALKLGRRYVQVEIIW